MKPDVVKCLESLIPGKRVAVVVKQVSHELPIVPVEPPPPAPVIPPPNPLAVIEETVAAVKDALIVVQQGQEAIVRELRKPVIPKYDDRGKLIAAQRE